MYAFNVGSSGWDAVWIPEPAAEKEKGMTLGMEVVGSKTIAVIRHMKAWPNESQQGRSYTAGITIIAIECGWRLPGQRAKPCEGARNVKVWPHSGMDG